jgi:hypothetical protein
MSWFHPLEAKDGWISMSERDLKRIEVLSEVRTGRRTVAAAAVVLAVIETITSIRCKLLKFRFLRCLLLYLGKALR